MTAVPEQRVPTSTDLAAARTGVLLSGLSVTTSARVVRAVLDLEGRAGVRDGALQLEGLDLEVLLERISLLVPEHEAEQVRAVVLPRGESDPTALVRALRAGSLADLVRRRERLLGAVLRRGHWAAAYQPILDLRTGVRYGVESLLRVRLDGAPVPADELFRSARAEGLDRELDLRSIRTAVTGAAGRLDGAQLFVNTSASDVAGLLDVLGVLQEECAARRLPLTHVVLEITERRPITDLAGVARVLEPVRRRGMLVALDDLGSGFSSLEWLACLSPDFVKVGGSIVEGLPSVGSAAVLAGLVELTHRCGALLVAEQVSTEQQVALLKAAGVDLVQGFGVGLPAPL